MQVVTMWRTLALSFLFEEFAARDRMRFAEYDDPWERLRRTLPPEGSPFWNFPTLAHRVTDPGAP